MNKEELLDLYNDIPAPDLCGLKIVCLNGPPNSGKDSGADYLTTVFLNSRNMKFSEHLKRSIYGDYGLPYDLPIDYFDPVKEIPLDILFGKSFRQLCIAKSEEWMKKYHNDKTIFGKFFLRKLDQAKKEGIKLVFVSDSGFSEEVEPLVPYVGADNILQVQIDASGRCLSFKGDSRSYWLLPEIECAYVRNNTTLEDYKYELHGIVANWYFRNVNY